MNEPSLHMSMQTQNIESWYEGGYKVNKTNTLCANEGELSNSAMDRVQIQTWTGWNKKKAKECTVFKQGGEQLDKLVVAQVQSPLDSTPL